MADSTWDSIAIPILEAVAAEEKLGRRPDLARVVNVTGLAPDEVARELEALLDGDFVEGSDTSSLTSFDVGSLRLLERGKVAVREWPGDDAYSALIELIERRIADEKDPEHKGKLAKLREAIVAIGTGAGGNLFAELVRQVSSWI